MPTVTVNGTELYYEIRGMGPPVLLIMGATGDGGHFDALAELLAHEFTVVSYVRRGNGRSPVPDGWDTTSPSSRPMTPRPCCTPSIPDQRRSSAPAAAATSRCV
jgi:pimeloyl-ACP methyl ester carboxylesterase